MLLILSHGRNDFMTTSKAVSKYMSEIGATGGKRGTAAQSVARAINAAKAREARAAKAKK